MFADLFKDGGSELVEGMHLFIYRICQKESMLTNWTPSVFCHVLKTGDPTVFAKYKNISLLPPYRPYKRIVLTIQSKNKNSNWTLSAQY